MISAPHNPRQARLLLPGEGRGQRGFTFTEVMFAVIILGIGFIMVAAMFPVAVQQSKMTQEEGVAATIARSATSQIQPIVNDYTCPPTAKLEIAQRPTVVAPFGGRRFEALGGNLLVTGDPRLAFIPFYRRSVGSNVVQLIVLTAQSRNQPVYSSRDLGASTASTACTVTLVEGDRNFTLTTLDTLQFNSGGGTAAEGDYVRINDSTATVANGKIYRLGELVTGTTWRLAPGDAMTFSPGVDGIAGNADDVTDACASKNAQLIKPFNLHAKLVYIKTSEGGTGNPDRIQFFPNEAAATAGAPEVRAVEGAYIILADDRQSGVAGTPATYPGSLNGYFYKLGTNVASTGASDQGIWELAPGSDMSTIGTAYNENLPPRVIGAYPEPVGVNGWASGTAPVKAYIVGKGFTDPTNVASGYEGPAMDVAVYNVFVPVN